jgi:hypothetical protein
MWRSAEIVLTGFEMVMITMVLSNRLFDFMDKYLLRKHVDFRGR